MRCLCKHLHASEPRVSVSAATQILDRAYGRPVQSIDVREDGPTVRDIAEMPVKDKTTEEWLKGNAAYLASTKLAGEA